MTRNVRTYDHFCLTARALECVGDRWSLLVVRDLLTGAKRFTDLMDRLGGITPKTLSRRLHDLEDAGIVAADRKPGRREVWYRLTPTGADLEPVIDALGWWGLRHAWRRPQAGEPLHAEHLLRSVVRAIDLAAGDHEPAGISGSTVPTTWPKATAATGRSATEPRPGRPTLRSPAPPGP
jgi:DNA-binding HxlR family transcriptional regulator